MLLTRKSGARAQVMLLLTLAGTRRGAFLEGPHQLCERVGAVMLLTRKSRTRVQVMLLLPMLVRAGTRRGTFLEEQLATAHPVIKTDESTH